MNQSRRETDETSAELSEIRKDNQRLREDNHFELEKARHSEYSISWTYISCISSYNHLVPVLMYFCVVVYVLWYPLYIMWHARQKETVGWNDFRLKWWLSSTIYLFGWDIIVLLTLNMYTFYWNMHKFKSFTVHAQI